MSLDHADLAAIDARVDGLVRAGVASAVRLQAAALRSSASLMASEARTLEDTADAIEAGRMDPPARAVQLAVVPLEDDAPEEPDEPDTLQTLMAGSFGNAATLEPRDADELSPAMAEWLDRFDDRLRMSPRFVDAVNEAADADRVANEDTARMVAARVRELEAIEAGRRG